MIKVNNGMLKVVEKEEGRAVKAPRERDREALLGHGHLLSPFLSIII